jgi:hypothetical protein
MEQKKKNIRTLSKIKKYFTNKNYKIVKDLCKLFLLAGYKYDVKINGNKAYICFEVFRDITHEKIYRIANSVFDKADFYYYKYLLVQGPLEPATGYFEIIKIKNFTPEPGGFPWDCYPIKTLACIGILGISSIVYYFKFQ